MTKEKILLDTDIGNDIDDSVSIAYLLKQKQCELLGITTVTGEPVERAKLTSVLLKAAGREDIPIYPGVENPLLIQQKQQNPHQVRYLHNWPHETNFPKGEAIEFMRRTIRENPGEITLLTIGPLTNAALLFAVDPEIPYLLKGLVSMCGVFNYRYKNEPCLTEWNARCDPHSTAIVYNAPVKNMISIGLDVTTQVTLEKDELCKLFDRDLLKVVLAFSGLQDNTRESITFHDPLAAAIIFEKDICKYERCNVEVETGCSRLEGLTYWTRDETGNDEIAVSVDRKRFFKHYFNVFDIDYIGE